MENKLLIHSDEWITLVSKILSPLRMPLGDTTNIRPIERGLVMMGCVVDLSRVLNTQVQDSRETTGIPTKQILYIVSNSTCVLCFVFAALLLARKSASASKRSIGNINFPSPKMFLNDNYPFDKPLPTPQPFAQPSFGWYKHRSAKSRIYG